MAQQRAPVLKHRKECLRGRRQNEFVDLEDAAGELPDDEQPDSEQPGRELLQGRAHALRTSAILARSSCTMSVKRGSKQMSRSRGRGRSTNLLVTIRPGRALMTCTLSARNVASRRSWVTRMTVKPISCQRSRNTHRNSSRVN